MAIAALLLFDLLARVPDLRAMYTDEGMFPRADIHYRITTIWNWSFHFASGALWYQAILFCIAGALALALLAGAATRIATIASWLMLLSIHHRVPAILSGAEVLMRMLLFWAMFLPLGRVWSVDRWRARRKNVALASEDTPVLSVASAAMLLQMGVMYLFSAISKTNSQWLSGHALAGILAHDFYASPPADYFLRFPGLLKVLTWATLLLEWAAPVFLFFPKWTAPLRLGAICALAAMHIGIGISLEVGLFSYVAVAGLSLFLPAEFWNRLLPKFRRNTPNAQPATQQQKGAISVQPVRVSYATQGAALLALLYVVALNLTSFARHSVMPLDPADLRFLRTGLGLSQSWGMFGEIPSMDGWYVARAKLRDGSVVDLLRNGAPLDWNRPRYPARLYPNHLWQKLFREMTYFDDQGFQVYRAPVAEYLCRNWNRRNPAEKQVADFEFIFCVEDKDHTPSASSPRVFRRQLVRLDFRPGNEEPVVSGYTDAPQGAGAP